MKIVTIYVVYEFLSSVEHIFFGECKKAQFTSIV